jgi:hypothetical protein
MHTPLNKKHVAEDLTRLLAARRRLATARRNAYRDLLRAITDEANARPQLLRAA